MGATEAARARSEEDERRSEELAVMYAGWVPKFPGVRSITVDELMSMMSVKGLGTQMEEDEDEARAAAPAVAGGGGAGAAAGGGGDGGAAASGSDGPRGGLSTLLDEAAAQEAAAAVARVAAAGAGGGAGAAAAGSDGPRGGLSALMVEAAARATVEAQQQQPQVAEQQPQETLLRQRLWAERRLVSSLVLVDVRDACESDVSVIASRCTLTRRQFEARAAELRDVGTTVVCYCTVGYRSGMYAASLVRRDGFDRDRVFNLEGSILAATQAGMPLVTPHAAGATGGAGGCAGGAAAAAGAGGGPGSEAAAGAGVATSRVHVWGASFARLAGTGYDPVVPPPATGARLALGAAWQTVTSWWAGDGRKL
ncbi:hypothetical protein FOA52_010660 [Chlamydomonas sp. UWO 241]|nr:hypothetical protein FOA52_010660 [Chlamydomonas sp. UWO 241]